MSLPDVLSAWSLEPSVVLGLGLSAALYGAGLRGLAARGRLGRTVARHHVVLFVLGLLALLVALASPIDALADRLLTLHMVQHTLLLAVAPPLVLLGRPVPVLLVGAPRGLVRFLARTHRRIPGLRMLTRQLVAPLAAWLLYTGALLAWHLPAFYQAALQNEGVHVLEHLCFLATGLLFWWVVVAPLPGRRRHLGLRMIYLWLAALPSTGLAVLLVVQRTLWYPYYAARPRLFGLSPLDDQHLAGAVMWASGDSITALALGVLAYAARARQRPANL